MKLNSHEQHCLDNATSFTAVRGMGFKRVRAEFADFDSALAYCAQHGDKRTMVYAVTAEGRDAHICNA